MFDRRQALGHRMISGVDLLIDLATLGEYGIEPQPADGPCGERTGRAARPGRAAGREALAQARRGACRAPRRRADRPERDLELWFRQAS